MRERANPGDWFEREEIERARAYSRGFQRRSVVVLGVAIAVLLASIVGHVSARLIHATGVHAWALQVLLVTGALSLSFWVFGLPADLWLLTYQQRWGVRPPSPFWREVRDDFLVSVIGIPAVVLALLTVIRETSLWWIVLSFVVLVVGVVARFTPLLRRLERLEDRPLEDRLRRLARDAGVRALDVYVGKAASGPFAQDAVIAGLGRTSRIVLGEDVLKRPIKEIEVALAMKISSWRLGPSRRLAFMALAAPILFLPSHLIITFRPLERWAGITSRSDPAAIPLLIAVFVPCLYVVGYLLNWQVRRRVRLVDADALDFTRDPDAFDRYIRAMYARMMVDLAPSFVQRLRSSYPPPAERLAMAARWREGRRVAVLFTDVEDATPLVERLGDEAWYDVLQDHNEILRKHVAVHRGREPASAGDGFLFVFDDVGEALICAIEIQRDLHRYADERSIDIRVRMGAHTGEVIRKGDAVIGREVHVAARIAASAAGGEILVSGQVHDLLASTGRFRFGGEQELTLRGLSGMYRVFEVDWHEDALVRQRAV